MDNALTTRPHSAVDKTSQTLQPGSIAHNTKRMYCHATTHFLNWCEKIDQAAQTSGDLDGVLMQAAVRFHGKHVTPEEINQYLTHLHLNGKSPASIASVLTAIKFMARHTGTSIDFLPADTTLKGIKRNAEAQARGRGQATGIKVDDAITMATIADSPAHTSPTDSKETPEKAWIRRARDAAIILTMSNGLLRISEVGAILCEHISTRENGSGSLLIPRLKTDQEAEGREVYLQKRTIKAIEKYQRLSGVSDGPLFRRIYQNSKMGKDALGITAIRDMIKDVAEKAQIDVTGISGHSFRVGTAQTLVEKKATMLQLQTAGRWKDTRMPARYTEKEELAKGVIATILGE
ncbi:MAG: tyrosine-type recombinase/integrase [Gemmatimonadetes bacterium]|nr:tyrosine-type recombinase/integrase [Gemmatimonadota bacterium]